MSSSKPSSGPSKSHRTSRLSTPSPMPKFGARSTLLNLLFITVSFSEPSSGPCKSYRKSKQPTLHPAPMPSSEPPNSRHALFDELHAPLHLRPNYPLFPSNSKNSAIVSQALSTTFVSLIYDSPSRLSIWSWR